MTPQKLYEILADTTAHHRGTHESIIKLMNGGKSSSAVLTLKQMTRIRIRRHLSEELQVRGKQLIERINSLALPNILKRYLLYQGY